LDRGLSAGLARWRATRAVHDPGQGSGVFRECPFLS